MKPLRILLADDHSLILAGVARLLGSKYDIVGTAEDGRALLQAALRLKPDLVVLDVSMPILNGIDAAREIKRNLPSTKFVFLTMHSNPIYLRKAIETGALGYVLKSGAAEELLTAVEEAAQGRLYVTPAFGQHVVSTSQTWFNKPTKGSIHLTARQRGILQLIAEGKQNKEIAEISHISVKTVEFHRSRLMEKLGAHGVAELTRCAIEYGLLTLPGSDPENDS